MTFIIESNTNLTQHSDNRIPRPTNYHSIMLYHVMHVTKNMTASCHISVVSQQKMQKTTSQNMTTSSQNIISHIPRNMPRNQPRKQKYDSCQSYNTSAKNMTTQSHMPRRIGIFFARAGPRRAQTPRPVKACHTCCWDRRFCPFIRPHSRIYSYD